MLHEQTPETGILIGVLVYTFENSFINSRASCSEATETRLEFRRGCVEAN
jgi:hypothetical protein